MASFKRFEMGKQPSLQICPNNKPCFRNISFIGYEVAALPFPAV